MAVDTSERLVQQLPMEILSLITKNDVKKKKMVRFLANG